MSVGSLVHFRRSVHFYHWSSTEQGFFGSNEWVRTITGVHRARDRPSPGHHDVFVVDRRGASLSERRAGALFDHIFELRCHMDGVVVAKTSFQGSGVRRD